MRLNQLKRCVWNLPGKRKVFRTVTYPVKVNLWGCFSCNDFSRIYCFRENSKANLLCKIFKRCLLPTTLDEMQLTGNYRKRMIQSICPALQNNGDRTIQFKELIGHPCHQTWTQSKTFRSFWRWIWQKKNLRTYKALVSPIKKQWKNFPKDLTINLVRSLEIVFLMLFLTKETLLCIDDQSMKSTLIIY